MPDSSGKLTDEETQQIKSWVDARVGGQGFACSICNSSKWIIADHLVSPPMFGTGLVLGGAAYPLAMFICSVCAHTVFLNAVVVGVSPPLAEPEKKGEEETEEKGEEKVEQEADDV